MLYINLWKARDGSYEAQPFTQRRDALEEIGAEYPGMSYAGTVTVSLSGKPPIFESWAEEAHLHAMEATEEWLDEQRLAQAYRSRVL